MIKITVENEHQTVIIEERNADDDMEAELFAYLLFRVMIGMGYSEELAKKMFNGGADI